MWPLSNRNFCIAAAVLLVALAGSAVFYVCDNPHLEYGSELLYDYEPAVGDNLYYQVHDSSRTTAEQDYTLHLRIESMSPARDYVYCYAVYTFNDETLAPDVYEYKYYPMTFFKTDLEDIEDNYHVSKERIRDLHLQIGTVTTHAVTIDGQYDSYINVKGYEEHGDIDATYDVYRGHLVQYKLEVHNETEDFQYSMLLKNIVKASA